MRGEDQPLKVIKPVELLANAGKLRREGYRIVQICCTSLPGRMFELTYAFDKDYKYASFRIVIPAKSEIPSITGEYAGAYLYENEIRELFGVNFKGISVDYNGHLYVKKMETPFALQESAACEKKEGKSCRKG